LRHTCASLLIAAKANPLEIAEQLGHLRGGKPDPTMIWKRYGWLYEGATKAAVMRLDDLIA
jgi:integrase